MDLEKLQEKIKNAKTLASKLIERLENRSKNDGKELEEVRKKAKTLMDECKEIMQLVNNQQKQLSELLEMLSSLPQHTEKLAAPDQDHSCNLLFDLLNSKVDSKAVAHPGTARVNNDGLIEIEHVEMRTTLRTPGAGGHTYAADKQRRFFDDDTESERLRKQQEDIDALRTASEYTPTLKGEDFAIWKPAPPPRSPKSQTRTDPQETRAVREDVVKKSGKKSKSMTKADDTMKDVSWKSVSESDPKDTYAIREDVNPKDKAA